MEEINNQNMQADQQTQGQPIDKQEAQAQPEVNPVDQTDLNQSPLVTADKPSFPWKIVIPVGIAVLLFIPASIFIFIKVLPKDKAVTVPSLITGENNQTLLTNYSKDTDNDGYPDYVETENGFDPLVSEYDRCKKGSCDEAQLQNTQVSHNVLLILDASGSMALGIGTQKRIDIAKQAIKNYIGKANTNLNIGLMIYGHKGSNSQADKPASCVSAETISSIGSVNSGSIDNILAGVNPVGWTPMGYALQQAAAAFAGKEGQNNEIILLSDGEETCDSDPVGQAAALKSSAMNIKINVIGFAVEAKAQTQLNQISSSGGGSFAIANNLTELDQKFNDLYENGLKIFGEMKCKSQGLDEFRACYKEPFDKISQWVNDRKLKYYNKEISQEEFEALDSLGTKLYSQYGDITSKETQQLNQQFQQDIQQIRGE
ncbi:VWA domain-containing protein [Patescibacteria group bacterium]